MDQTYYNETVDKLQKMNVDQEYLQGWIGGYMKNPKREEQRTTDAYDAGFEDGEKGEIGDTQRWGKA